MSAYLGNEFFRKNNFLLKLSETINVEKLNQEIASLKQNACQNEASLKASNNQLKTENDLLTHQVENLNKEITSLKKTASLNVTNLNALNFKVNNDKDALTNNLERFV